MKTMWRRFFLRGMLVGVAILALVSAFVRRYLPEPPDPIIPEGARLYIPPIRGTTTLVGYISKRPTPWPRGNCFEMSPWPRKPGVILGKERHVLNMHAENFEEIVKKLGLKTVEVQNVGGFFLVVDPRIPREWFKESPCRHCVRAGVADTVLTRHRDKFRRPSINSQVDEDWDFTPE